jgi:hypothetical protein
LCNSRCHNSVNCLNKWSMYYVSQMHYTGKFAVTCIWLFIFVIIKLHLTKLWPPCWDSFLLAWRSDTLLSLLMSDSLRSRWGHKSNWCRLYFPFRIPEGQPMVYCPFTTANITSRISTSIRNNSTSTRNDSTNKQRRQEKKTCNSRTTETSRAYC